MAESNSPLGTIHTAEITLQRRVAAARHQRQSRIDAAHAAAEQMLTEATGLSKIEGEKQYAQLVAQVRKEAEAIVAAAHTKAMALEETVKSRLESTVQQIVALVLQDTIQKQDRSHKAELPATHGQLSE